MTHIRKMYPHLGEETIRDGFNLLCFMMQEESPPVLLSYRRGLHISQYDYAFAKICSKSFSAVEMGWI